MEKEVVSSIGKGILVFAAVAPGDTEKEAESLAAKVLKMKLWDDESGGRVYYHPFSPLRYYTVTTSRANRTGFSGRRMYRILTVKSSVVSINGPAKKVKAVEPRTILTICA